MEGKGHAGNLHTNLMIEVIMNNHKVKSIEYDDGELWHGENKDMKQSFWWKKLVVFYAKEKRGYGQRQDSSIIR